MDSGQFSLPSKRSLLKDIPPEVVVIDITECETERPKKTAQNIFRRESELQTGKVLCAHFGHRHVHDFV